MNISIAAEPIFYIGSFPVTNTLLVAPVISAVVAALGAWGTRAMNEIPAGAQNAVEAIIETIFDFIDRVTGDRTRTKQFFPVVATIFIFVLCSNLFEVIPGLGTIGVWEIHHGVQTLVPLLRSPSADLNFTIAVAVIAVISLQVLGIMSIGAVKYIKKFINLHGPINFFVGLLELVSEVAKIVSFSFRLFGNIFAGEVLLTVILFLVPLIAPLPFLFLELFVGFVQALVFAMLTLVFLTLAVAETEH